MCVVSLIVMEEKETVLILEHAVLRSTTEFGGILCLGGIIVVYLCT